MATWHVKQFPHGTVSDDGTEITIEVDLGAGRKGKLVIPFSQLDWLQQALLSLATGAYERQLASGRLLATTNVVADQSMRVETLRVMADTKAQNILVQAAGRSYPDEPLGMGSIILDEEKARELAARLIERAEQLRQSRRPS